MVVTIFGSSAPREGSEDYSTAFECGSVLARAGYTICNGGYAGTMEAAAQGARAAGGKTIGITISGWKKSANEWINEEIKTAGLEERLSKLVELGDAFLVLRGGSGTLLELAYILELINKDLARKRPIILLGDWWDGVIEALRNEPISERQKDCTRLLHKVESPVELVRYLSETLRPPASSAL